MKRLNAYIKVWYLTASNALQRAFVNRSTNLLFMIGKVIRFAMNLTILLLIRNNIQTFAGYSADEMIVFFLTFQFIDTLAQVFFRGTYLIGNEIRTGEFDFTLTKPISPLFQALTGKPDINDAFLILPTTLISIWIAMQLDINVSLISFLWYLIMLVNGFIIAMGLHIIIMAFAMITTEVDGAVWIYRDMMLLGRFPVNIYLAPVKFMLFFLIPIGMMITIPSEILLQTPPTYSATVTIALGITFLFASLKIWNLSLKKYSSASS